MENPPAPKELVLLAHPWGDLKLTYSFLAVFACVFGIELYLSHSFSSPTMAMLFLLGGCNHDLVVRDHEYFRVLTAGLLHGGWIHLLFNSYAFYYAGTTLEPLLGRAWLFCLFWIGVAGGSLVGIQFNDPRVLSVGASGGIMGLLAAMFVVAHRIPPGQARNLLRVNALQVLIPSLVPIGLSIGGSSIDYGAHAGGAIAGALGGLLVLLLWPRSRPRPLLRLATLGLTFAIAGTVLYAVGQVARSLPKAMAEWNLAQKLAPARLLQAELHKSQPDILSLLARYPHDPGLHYYQGKLLVMTQGKKGRVEAAEHFRMALGERDILELFYSNTELEWRTRIALAELVEPTEVPGLLSRYCGTEIEAKIDAQLRKVACP